MWSLTLSRPWRMWINGTKCDFWIIKQYSSSHLRYTNITSFILKCQRREWWVQMQVLRGYVSPERLSRCLRPSFLSLDGRISMQKVLQIGLHFSLHCTKYDRKVRRRHWSWSGQGVNTEHSVTCHDPLVKRDDLTYPTSLKRCLSLSAKTGGSMFWALNEWQKLCLFFWQGVGG